MKHNKKISALLLPSNVVNAVIITNVVIFVISLIFSGRKTGITLNPLFLLTPSSDVLLFLGATGKMVFRGDSNWASLITANWLHAGLLHIFFNMMAFRTIAPLVIYEFGTARMFTIYTLTGICGFLLSVIGNVSLTIGASSGLCGLVGAALFFGKTRKGAWGEMVFRQTTGWVISLVVIGFLIPNVNNWSHAGGLLSGIFFAWLFSYNARRRENLLDILIAIFLAFLTVFLLLSNVIEGVMLVFF